MISGEELRSLTERLPPGTLSTHHGELWAHARDRWPLAILQEARGSPVSPPAAVAFPITTEHVSTILAWAQTARARLVPRGAGSGVSGGAQAVRGSLLLDLSRMNRILEVDDVSHTVTAQAGVRGSDLEDALGPKGLTVGHHLEPLATSTVGGWIATGSAVPAFPGYGGIEDLLLGITAVMPGGDVVRLKPVPRSAAGPDLRRLFVASEGILGVVTEATLSVSRLPTGYGWEALGPRSFDSGMALAREIMQRRFRPLALRLFDDAEAAALFSEVGHRRGPLMIIGVDTGAPAIETERFELRRLARDLGARALPVELAEHWWAHRFDAPSWTEGALGAPTPGAGTVVDTCEIGALWRRLPGLYERVRTSILGGTEIVWCHLEHPTHAGACLSFRWVIRAESERHAERRYQEVMSAATKACLQSGGTISHHGGVGLRRAQFMEAEVGPAAMAALRSLKAGLDPHRIMNPGKVLPEGPSGIRAGEPGRPDRPIP